MTRKPITPAERSGSRKYQTDVFFQNVQNRRIKLGLKQDDLAKMLNMHRAHISRLEAGAFPKDPRRIVELAKVLDVSLDWLFGIDKNNP